MDAAFLRHPAPAAASSLGPLFDPPPPPPAPLVPAHRERIATSAAWATRQAPKFGSKADRVLRYLESRGRDGATRAEIAHALGAAFPINIVCPAVDALRKRGLVVQLEAQRNGGHLLCHHACVPTTATMAVAP